MLAVDACVEAAYAMYVERIGKRPAPMLDDYENLVSQGRVWVATSDSDGTLVGLIVRWPVDNHLYIDNIATIPEARSRGVGAALLADTDKAARLLGLTELRLYTNVSMIENLDYYPRVGFVETHREVQDGYDRVFYARPVKRDRTDSAAKHY